MNRFFDEVEIGHGIKAFSRIPISRVQLAHFAAASDDFSPLHLDDEFAKSAGFGSVFAPNLIALDLCHDAMRAFAKNMTIISSGGTFLRLIWPGDVLTAKGLVLQRYSKHNEHRIVFSLWVENQNGDVVMKGQSTCLLFKNAAEAARLGLDTPKVSEQSHEVLKRRCEKVINRLSHPPVQGKVTVEKELA